MDASDTLDNAPLAAAEAAPAAPPPRPLGAFAFDAAMAIVLLLALSVLFGIAWGVAQGFMAATGGVAPGDVAAAIGTPGTMATLWMAAFGTGGAALILYFWRRPASPTERADSLAAARRPATWGWTVLVAAVVFAATTGLHWALTQAGLEVEPTNQKFIQDGLALYPVQVLVFAVLLAPAYEELLFRRVLFGRLWAAGKPWLGVVMSSVVFALMHEIPGTGGNPIEVTLLLWLVYGFMGAAFAWVYWRTGTLWAAFAAHALNNLVSCLLLFGMA